MNFLEVFKEKFIFTLTAVRNNDCQKALEGLEDICTFFANQHDLKNNDTIDTKAKLLYWKNLFADYVDIVKTNGLLDSRVQEFFGLIDAESTPSFNNIIKGTDKVPNDPLPIDNSDDNLKGISQTRPKRKDTIGEINPIVEVEPIKPIDVVEPIQEGEITYNPSSLHSFIGQQHIVKPLLKEIAIAKNKGIHHLDNILLLGNPGLGKTTLMKLIAKELGVRYELMDCSQYRNSQQSKAYLQNFLMKVARDNSPVVIAFDEIHMLTYELQSSLLTLLNDRVYVSPPDVNGKIIRIPIDDFTFIAATTDDDKVLNTIKDRCLRLKFQMEDYSHDELKQIYKNKVKAKGLTISDEAIETSIPRSRGSIRYVNAFIEGFDKELHNDLGQRISTNIDLNVALRFFNSREIDEIGLEKKDIEILKAIEEISSNFVGAETLSAKVGLDSKKYLSEFEPYLIKIGFIIVSGKGRSLTEKAFNYLKKSENV